MRCLYPPFLPSFCGSCPHQQLWGGMLNQRCTPLPTHRASLHSVLEQVFRHHLGSQVSASETAVSSNTSQLDRSLSWVTLGLGKTQLEKLRLQRTVPRRVLPSSPRTERTPGGIAGVHSPVAHPVPGGTPAHEPRVLSLYPTPLDTRLRLHPTRKIRLFSLPTTCSPFGSLAGSPLLLSSRCRGTGPGAPGARRRHALRKGPLRGS